MKSSPSIPKWQELVTSSEHESYGLLAGNSGKLEVQWQRGANIVLSQTHNGFLWAIDDDLKHAVLTGEVKNSLTVVEFPYSLSELSSAKSQDN